MGRTPRRKIAGSWPATAVILIVFLASPMTATAASPPKSALAVADNAAVLDTIRNEINTIEKDLLQSRESQLSAANQLRKIKKLLALQQKEIALSRKRIAELSVSLNDLSAQKQMLLANIEEQKIALRKKLHDLNQLTEAENVFDASWLSDIDSQAQKEYFLAKTIKKDLASMAQLRDDVLQAQGLELRIVEERNKLDYYVQELGTEMTMLGANQDVQKEIIRTNRANRLDALSRIRSLKESEHELENVLASFHAAQRQDAQKRRAEAVAKNSAIQKIPKELPPLDVSFALLKGKLFQPVEGNVLSAFGKSYNPKTNLLTFQKGVTFGSRRAATVQAVSAGKVVFAGPLRNYGLIAIVEHPGQYYTLYGQMGSVAVVEGAVVRQGDLLGKTADEPLYFEIRTKNVAINPLQWFSGGSITLSKQ